MRDARLFVSVLFAELTEVFVKAIDRNKYGPWALVTGASAGLGAGFARQLAQMGLNVALAARRKELLDGVAGELESEHGVETRAIAVDLARPDALAVIDKATSDLEIGLLVNNAAGMAAGALVKSELSDMTDLVHVNVLAPMSLALRFGRKMTQRGRGGIVLVSSIGGYSSMPNLANYMATKSYLIALGEALRVEMRARGVDVTVLCPGGIDSHPGETLILTGMREGLRTEGMSVARVAAIGLHALGRRRVAIPGLLNQIIVFFIRLLPRRLGTAFFWQLDKERPGQGIPLGSACGPEYGQHRSLPRPRGTTPRVGAI